MRPVVGLVVALIALAVPLRAESAPVAPVITMAFGFDPAREPLYRYFERLYTEAFRRLGYGFSYGVYPLARCSILADDGEVDGEPQRIKEYQEAHPQLVRVDASILTNRTIAYGRAATARVASWTDVAALPGTVVYLIGAVANQRHLAGLIPEARLVGVTTVEQGLEMVRAGRAVAFVDIEARSRVVWRSARFAGTDLVVLGVVETAESFPYLHQSRADLVGPLAATLQTMRKDGTMVQLLRQEIPGLSLE